VADNPQYSSREVYNIYSAFRMEVHNQEHAWAGKYPATSHEPVSHLFALGTNTCLLTQEQVPINGAYPPEK